MDIKKGSRIAVIGAGISGIAHGIGGIALSKITQRFRRDI